MTNQDQLSEEPGSIQAEGNKEKRAGEVIITLRRWHIYAILLPVVFVLGLALGFLARDWLSSPPDTVASAAGSSASTDSPVAAPAAGQAEAASTQQVVRYEVPVDDDPALGSADAPITIVEFSDYECPYCRQWHTEVYQQLIDTYGDQIRFVYRDFPLESIHPNANSAAQAANCANEQGEFWAYHDLLFSMELDLGEDTYLQYASQLDLDQAAFKACFDSGRYQQEVQADFDFAAQLGVRSTPTFFINGIAVVGAQPFDIFQQVIERELAGEIP